MKLIFMGTPDFAVPCLEALLKAGHEVTAVFTQPDKPKGRGYTLTPPPVKTAALKQGIEVYQPKTLKSEDVFSVIKEINPQAVVVVAYGKILPENILSLPEYGCINIHASLLPKYRGAAPIQWAVINGERESGVTAMRMDSGLDTGDVLLKASTAISENETAGELSERLSVMGAELLVETLSELEKGSLTPCKQGESPTAYAAMLDKSICKIDWNDSADAVHNKVRGLSPRPVAVTTLNGKNVKIYQTVKSEKSGLPGEIISVSPLTVACGKGAVEIMQLQLEGKKRMDSKSFLLGHPLRTHAFFGK